MGLGGPNLVKGATGQTIDGETLGGAVTHTEISGVAHYAVDDDDACLAQAARSRARSCRAAAASRRRVRSPRESAAPQTRSTICCRPTTACRTTCTQILRAIVDDGKLDEFQEHLAREMICGDARIDGIAVGVIANQRGLIKGRAGREAALRRHRLRRERGEGRVLHRPLRPAGHSAAVRAGRLRLHGRPRGRARRNHSRRRALRRGDGDGARAEDRAHGEPRVGRRLLRDGGPGLRSRFHLLAGRRDAWP